MTARTRSSRRRRRTVAAVATLLALAVVASAAATRGPKPAPLTVRLAQALAVPNVSHARSAAVAVDLRSGQVLFSRRGSLPLAPASTEKLAVGYAALTALGAAHRIPTRVFAEGATVGATLRGRLVLKGYGDPTLSRADLRAFAQRVRARGIRFVTGGVVGDESFFDARRTAAGWKPRYYLAQSPPLSALVVDRARYAGRLSRRPALSAAALLRRALRKAGVAVAGRATVGRASSGATLVAGTSSPTVARLLAAVNRESDNFTAELLLKYLGAAAGGRGSSAAGAAVVREQLELAGVRIAGVRIVDGSGLSLLDRLTADALAGILTAAWSDPHLRRTFYGSLAVSGRSGTLSDRLRRLRGRVVAKTGTTSFASALAGYAGRRYAFAVLHNGNPVSSWWARVAQDRFASVLARN